MPHASPTVFRPVPTAPAARFVRVLDHDPDLADGLPPDEAAAAASHLVAPALRVRAGRWTPPPERPASALGMLVLEGLALREVSIAGRRHVSLIGRGDVVDPWSRAEAMLLATREHRIEQPLLAAVLDRRFIGAAQRWPVLFETLMRRMTDRNERLTALSAIVELPRVELRLLAVFWQAAQRWGRVRADGVLVPVPLTHETLGRLVGARRPTVTIALAELAAEGAIRRLPTRAVILALDSWNRLADGPCPVGGALAA